MDIEYYQEKIKELEKEIIELQESKDYEIDVLETEMTELESNLDDNNGILEDIRSLL